MSSASGETSERYHLVRRLGSGAFGTVYLARDLFLDEDVAVKMPIHEHPDLMSFLQEPRLLNRVRDPHIVALRDIERIQGVLCLVMEYVSGGSLRDRMGVFGRGNALPQSFVVNVGRGVLRALGAAHALGVLHRDIKPDNVLITEDGAPKVTDFGIARIVQATGGVDRTMQPGGTIVYMSPDALRGEISRPADLWATGAMLYEMLTGRLPFPGPSTADIVNQIMHGVFRPIRELNAEISPSLAQIIHKALALAPSDRFPDAASFDAALAEEEREGKAAKAPTAVPVAPPPMRPRASPAPSHRETDKMIDVSIAAAKVEDLPMLEEKVRQLLKDYPADPLFHRALGNALRRMGRDAEAYDEFERAFLLDRTDRAAAEGLADLGLRLRRPRRTAEALLALVEIEANNASYQRRLAMAFEQNGERGRAIAHMKRSLALEPEQPRMRRILKRWEEGGEGRVTGTEQG